MSSPNTAAAAIAVKVVSQQSGKLTCTQVFSVWAIRFDKNPCEEFTLQGSGSS